MAWFDGVSGQYLPRVRQVGGKDLRVWVVRGQAQPANLAAVVPAKERLVGPAMQLTELGGFDRSALMPSPNSGKSPWSWSLS